MAKVTKTAEFELEKETKNTFRFKEILNGQPPIIGTIYLQKWLFKGKPTNITVTVEFDE